MKTIQFYGLLSILISIVIMTVLVVSMAGRVKEIREGVRKAGRFFIAVMM
ncbi:MAG: hypothetical protein ACLT0Y_00760 [Christensenellales bacterium]